MSLTEQLKDGKQAIDWEQRRYEIAKEVYCINITDNSNTPDNMVASRAIKLADVLIKALRGY
ncbi:hypothetical protein [Proteiniphilum propionicum]|jgi:hypothetical protein|uniref:hypothetical protein n=1 Tax=Proteiniphilum propionicum TaxID=2829812 RepID=UPI001EECE826|nr:hypothetical protein [Proteiniphilum propionicum]ULB33615.1 hypothetical protein KDN43_11415 [Proteiniphilum propionicum]